MPDRTEPMPTQAVFRSVKHDKALHPALFLPVETGERTYRKKPDRGGLWTSTYFDFHPFSAWGDWCQENEWSLDVDLRLFTLEPESGARVYEVNSYEDLVWLFTIYGRDPKNPIGMLYRTERELVWENIAADYDAVHLTEQGQYETHLSMPYDLYGWDCESTLWLRWAFTDYTDRGVIRLASHDWSTDDTEADAT